MQFHNWRNLTGWGVFFGTILIALHTLFFPSQKSWVERYEPFNVPAFTYPGGDARNIQVSAHCARSGFDYFGENDCLKNARIVKAVHPEANVPPLNYPSIWPKLYALFSDDSEKFFIWFWSINALLLIAAVIILCAKYNPLYLPILIGSPISMLAIERGNNDGIVFFLTFVPLIAFHRNQCLQSFFMGIATSLKIFPMFGYLAFSPRVVTANFRATLLGAVCAAPFVFASFSEISKFLGSTTKGYHYAYGLQSLKYSPLLSEKQHLLYVLFGFYLILWCAAMRFAKKNSKSIMALDKELSGLKKIDLQILIASSSIFLLTFLIFTNWSYRLIFTIPAFLVLSKINSKIAMIASANIAIILLSPFANKHWEIQNAACYPLSIIVSIIIFRAMLTNPPQENSI